MNESQKLFERAQHVMPGGVNSPVRAFRSVGGSPRFIARADGAKLYDEDGNAYTDYIGSWGPMILGHNHPEIREAVERAVRDGLSYGAATKVEIEMAELLCGMSPCADMVRMVNSGTEAVMSALRVARGYTGRDKIVKFDGCYHGHCDSMLVKAGSGATTNGIPDSAGVPPGCAADTLSAVYNDLESVERLFKSNPGGIAAVIVEPVAANMGVVLPETGFLSGLRKICDAHGALLIFDEVITGFRLAAGGAQEYFSVLPDMAVYGKIIGAGMPVGAYAGRRQVMETVSPLGGVYQAGTLSGNPVAMSAGLMQLKLIKTNSRLYHNLNAKGALLRTRLNKLISESGAPCSVTGVGSLSCLFFTENTPRDYTSALRSDTAAYARYFNYMLDKSIYLAPAQFEAIFISDAHTEADISYFIECAKKYFQGELK